ncbi:MAG TPA: sulfotransferase, partial [Thermoanaerobaculia bacterium]|nr:sulfotransferase [Thermoanaerobaculia bacterium]
MEEPLVFVLAPPRSGSTLLRVMLGGHPHLFAPPELDLLSFADMAERRAAFSGRFAFWREGLARALMELLGEEAAVVEARLEALEEAAEPVAEVYRWLARVSAPRRLVDKTPAYTLDLAILERMEAEFRQPRYLRLLRHPAAVARSFEEAKLDQTFFRQPQPYGARRLGELVWVLAQRNIERFLAGVPPGRQLTVRFEELVKRPREVMEEVAGFLGLAFDEGMLEPYEDKKTRMTDGIHPLSKMLGDVKFHQHAGIDPEAAERWRAEAASGRLSAITWREAARLGYGAPAAGGGIAPLPRDGRPLPLSFAQQRLWFLQQLEPASPAYNIANAVRFRGPLGVAHLASAFDRLRQRHEVLRTAFP